MSRKRPGHGHLTSRTWPKESIRTACPFAPPRAILFVVQQARDMAKTIRKSERQRLSKRAHRGRSEVYRYLRKNLAALQADGFGTSTGPSWDELAETAHRDGYTNRNGERATGDAIRKIFARAVRDASLIPSTPASQAPSRQRADWQPPITATPRSAAARSAPEARAGPSRTYDPEEELPPRRPPSDAPVQPSAGVPGPTKPDELSPEAKAKFDKLRRQFAETDRKRFGSF